MLVARGSVRVLVLFFEIAVETELLQRTVPVMHHYQVGHVGCSCLVPPWLLCEWRISVSLLLCWDHVLALSFYRKKERDRRNDIILLPQPPLSFRNSKERNKLSYLLCYETCVGTRCVWLGTENSVGSCSVLGGFSSLTS